MSDIANLAALLLRIAGASASLAGAPQLDLGIQALEKIVKTLNDLVADANKALGVTEELKQLEIELREANEREQAKNAAKRAAKVALYEERKRVSELEERANQLRLALGGEKSQKPLPYASTSDRKLVTSSKVLTFADEKSLMAAVAADDAAAASTSSSNLTAPRMPKNAVAVLPAGTKVQRNIIVKMKEATAARKAAKADKLKNSGASASGDTVSREDPADATAQ
jgi:hypothetical protein